MVKLLARCRIGCQVAMLGLLGLLGMALIAGINFWGTTTVNRHLAVAAEARAAGNLDAQLKVAMLEGRREEKNFQLRRDETSISQHQTAMQAANKAIGQLAARAADQPATAAEVQQIRSDVGRYAAAFAALVSQARAVGLTENQGQLGRLRADVHDVEEQLKSINAPQAQIAMLMMRRHEKDFIARLDPQYAEALKARLPEFVAALDAASVSEPVKSAMMAKMMAYQESFARFAAGTLAALDADRNLGKVYADMEPRLAALDARFATRSADAQLLADDANAAAQRAVMLAVPLVALVVVGLCWLVGRGIARPIIAVTRTMEGLVRGALDTKVPIDDRGDEIGMMIRAVRSFRDSLVDAAHLREVQSDAQARAEADKHAALNGMAEQIEAGAGAAVKDIGERTAAMIATAEEMRALARRNGNSAQGAADSAAVALGNAQSVASAAEELSASIREISSQVSHSTAVVNQAVEASQQTRTTIEALNDTVLQIGAMAGNIGDIAARTNLLALNATIEAARAGEAGRGFAVVASEVKQLANQARRSSEEITRHISDVRSATDMAVAAVDRIGATIGEINGISSSIAAAVEQQGAATAEIARNVTQTAASVDAMSAMNGEVSRDAEQAGRYAEAVVTNAGALDKAVAALSQAMIRTVRTSTGDVDRRKQPRYAASLPCQVEFRGQGTISGQIVDLSEGGANLINLPKTPSGAHGNLRIDGFTKTLSFRVLNADENAVHVSFEMDGAGRDALQNFIRRLAMPNAA